MATVYGTNASETLNIFDGVTNGADTIWGYGGNDDIFGWGGNDVIIGGSGADDINGGSGVTVSLISNTGSGGYAQGDTLTSIENLTGSWYDDFLIGNDGNNVLAGLGGNDILKGGGGADTLYGDSGNDTLKGGGGADTLNGGSGIDTANYFDSSAGVFVSLYNDVAANGDAEGDELNSIENVTGSAYHDDLWGSDGVNVLNGGAGNDTLKGFGGNDTINGGTDNDTLYGMDGLDTMNGGAGTDTLIGGASGDRMTGGANADTFTFTSMADIGDGSGGGIDFDLITDFEIGTDHIDLSDIDADPTQAGNQAFTFVNAFTGVAGQLRVVEGFFDGASRPAVLIDLDGDAVEDAFFFVDTVGGALPSATDFML
jgi:Ca2+-binding RTX toxin-like protein